MLKQNLEHCHNNQCLWTKTPEKRFILLIIFLLIILTGLYLYGTYKPNIYLRLSSILLLSLLSLYQLFTTSVFSVDLYSSLDYLSYFMMSLSFFILSYFGEKNISSLHFKEFILIPTALVFGFLILLYASSFKLCGLSGLCEVNLLLFTEVTTFLSVWLAKYLHWGYMRRALNAYFPFGIVILLQLMPQVMQGKGLGLMGYGAFCLFFVIHFLILSVFHLPRQKLYLRLGIFFFVVLSVFILLSLYS